MSRTTTLRRPALAVAAAALALVLVPAGTALADTSTATANAISIGAVGVPITSGTQTAGNDGDQGTVTSGGTPALSVLGSQSLIGAGTLVQTATAFADGSSAACAGLVGTGGRVVIGPDGRCTVTAGSGGVQIKLTDLAVIKADAITARCTAASDGTVTGSATLANAAVYVAGLKTLTLAANATANTGLNVAALGLTVAKLVLNEQTVDRTAGKVSVSALDLAVLGSTVTATIGNVTCGGNVKVLPTPAVPVHAASIGGALAVLAGWALLARRVVRRRLATRSTAAGAR